LQGKRKEKTTSTERTAARSNPCINLEQRERYAVSLF